MYNNSLIAGSFSQLFSANDFENSGTAASLQYAVKSFVAPRGQSDKRPTQENL